MTQRIRDVVPQRWRLRVWLAYKYFAPGAFRLRGAQPSRRSRLVSHVALARRAADLPVAGTGTRSGLARLDGVRVINLRSRPDRLASALAEFERLGIERADRFEAISDDNRALGCSISHTRCLEEMLARGWDNMLVCEDDVEFLLDRRRLDALVDAFLDDPRAEVVCLAYFVWQSRPYNRLFLRGLSVQTAACYIVKRCVASELLETWHHGIEQLRRGGSPALYIADRSWAAIQQGHVFLVPIIRAARQRTSYSDLEGRIVTYGH